MAFYFLYYIKTPEYSLKLIHESIQKHDVAQFKKHVDLDSVLNKAFDDVLDVAMEVDENPSEDNIVDKGAKVFAKALFTVFKGSVVKELSENIIKSVEGNEGTETTLTDNKEADPSREGIDNIKTIMSYDNVTFLGIDSTKREGTIVIVFAKFKNPELDYDPVIEIKMRELGDGTCKYLKSIT